ncbi:MAG TPA: 3',5'-cyclic-nucleotide phosphodiesterase [Flavobacteriaceae bacterium]|nr:3',5'-cyclic-nucleotide phosphodiesterase [Flavobacteriaceae bacterium]
MRRVIIFLLFFISIFGYSQQFEVLPLGVYGGGDESNLSSYLVRDFKNPNYIACDAGTIRFGLMKAKEKGNLSKPPIQFLKENVKAYFISHSHLDHLSGMIINSPEDSVKPIYALPPTIQTLKEHYFINATWTNFANEGEEPILGKYEYKRMREGKSYAVAETKLHLTAFPLSHPVPSSAAWLHNELGFSILYLGDTGPDSIEGNDHLKDLWKAVGKDLKKGKLKAILIEVSFPNSQPDEMLFGHLTPKFLVEELQQLAKIAGKKSLKDFPVVVTHIKPDADNMVQIKKELQESNGLEVNYIFPEQGVPLQF